MSFLFRPRTQRVLGYLILLFICMLAIIILGTKFGPLTLPTFMDFELNRSRFGV